MRALAVDEGHVELSTEEENGPHRRHRSAFPTLTQATLAVVAVTTAAILLQEARSWTLRKAAVRQVVVLNSMWEQWHECTDNAMKAGGFCWGNPDAATCGIDMAFMCCKVVKASQKECCGLDKVKNLPNHRRQESSVMRKLEADSLHGYTDCGELGASTQPPEKQQQRQQKQHQSKQTTKLKPREQQPKATTKLKPHKQHPKTTTITTTTRTITTGKQAHRSANNSQDCRLYGGRCVDQRRRCYRKDAFFSGCREPPCTRIYMYDTIPRTPWNCTEIVQSETIEMK